MTFTFVAGKAGSQIHVPFRGDEYDYRHLRVMGDVGQIHFHPFRLSDEESIMKTMRYSNIVVNLIGQQYATQNYSFGDVHIEGARRIARCAARSGVERLIHVSALSASLSSPSSWLSSKFAGEEAVREAFPDATILRPSQFFGPEDKFLNSIAMSSKILFHLFPLVNGGVKTFRPVYVGDVAKAVIAVLQDKSSAGSTYELFGPKEYTHREIVDFVSESIRNHIRVVSVPLPLMRIFGSFLAKNPVKTYYTEENAIRDSLSEVYSENPTFDDLGISPCSLEGNSLYTLRRFRSSLHYSDPVAE
eukprot:Sdes_comp16241_c0_seq1m5541